MKRPLTNFIKILLFVVGFFFALYFFMEWRELGKFSVSLASSQLERRGMRLNYSDVLSEEGGFTVNNLTLNGFTNISFSSITIKPKFIASILSLGAVCDISFKGGNVRLGQNMNFGDGSFLLTAGRNQILLENLRTNGDFSINGYITFDPATMKIGNSEARFDVPEEFSRNMDTLRNFIPLTQEGGKWFLRRK